MAFTPQDHRYMTGALALARRGLGTTAPNPSVGCVIVKDGIIVGRGHTQPGGRPHAETEALNQAGEQAQGATVYVTLEPCSHHGKTPPCADALVAAGVSRVVCAVIDQNPEVNGSGIDTLKRAGITVEHGLLAEEATDLLAGFFFTQNEGRPAVTLKLASSLDGRIALGDGSSQWITGPDARRYAHHLRATHDGILVGSGTALADDPQLSCRLPGAASSDQPVRVIFDRRGRVPLHSRLVSSAEDSPVWIVTSLDTDAAWREALSGKGVHVLTPPAGHLTFDGMVRLLAQQGLTRLLLEGGSALASAALQAGLVDDLVWITAAKVLGGDALPAIGPLGLTQVPQSAAFRLRRQFPLDADCVSVYTRA